MDTITLDDVLALKNNNEDGLVSLYMPTHPTGPEVRQDPIRFQNLLRETEQRLGEQGINPDRVRKIINSITHAVEDEVGWKTMQHGLAVFGGNSDVKVLRLPTSCKEMVFVGEQYYIRPLIPQLSGENKYYILALSLGGNKLFSADKAGIEEIPMPDAPENIDAVLEGEVYHEGQQFHSGTHGGDKPGRAAIFHGHGDEEDRNEQAERYFRALDEHVSSQISDNNAPLVIHSVDHLVPIYKKVSSHKNLYQDHISGNPESVHVKEIHQQTWDLVKPHFAKEKKAALDEFRSLHGTDKASGKIDEIWQSALQKKIKVLFLNESEYQWGEVNTESGKMSLLAKRKPGAVEILDIIAGKVLSGGGKVYSMKSDEMPTAGMVNAVYRF